MSLEKSSLNNKRRAYFEMCAVGIVMLVSKLSGYFASYVYTYFFSENYTVIERFLANVIVALFGRGYGVSMAAANSILQSVVPTQLFSMFITMLTLFLPVYIFARSRNFSVSESFDTSGGLVKNFFPVYCAASLFMSAGSVIGRTFFEFLFPDSLSSAASDIGGYFSVDAGVFSLVISIVDTAILVPIVEEYAFRGVIFKTLRKYGTNFAVVASAFAFGIMHFSANQSMFAFAFGLFSAMLVVVTGNIKTSVLFHALNNLSMAFSDYFLTNNYTKYWIYSDLVLIVTTVIGFYGLYCLFKPSGTLSVYCELCEKEDRENGVYRDNSGLFQMLCVTVLIFFGFYFAGVILQG